MSDHGSKRCPAEKKTKNSVKYMLKLVTGFLDVGCSELLIYFIFFKSAFAEKPFIWKLLFPGN